MKAPCLFLVLVALLSGGCSSSRPPETFVGIATDGEDWPFRYTIIRTNGRWSGMVDFLDRGGWVLLDKMQVTEQKAARISFKALSGAPDKGFLLGWYLDLGDSSGQSFSGRLTGDLFD